jgi:NADH-quinone oxidoreductase subunit N
MIAQQPIATPDLTFAPLLPELILAVVGIAGMLYEAIVRRPERGTHLALGFIGVIAATAVSIPLWNWAGEPTVLAGTIAADRFSVVARLVLLAVAALALVYGTHALGRPGSEAHGEFFPLVLFATMGMTLITAAADLIVVFLALEILSLSLYVLTGITGRRSGTEASMKYFLLGAFSSAFFLYGVAMAYGAANSTKIVDVANALAGRTGSQALALMAVAFLGIGFGFKVSAAPFHMWTPDVYQGAATPVTAFMSAATKVAAFMALIRVFSVAFHALTWEWTPIIWGLAAASVVVGSVLAIAQTDVKRMLAYSSVAHAGFILTGLTAGDADGIRAAMFYLVAYAAMTVGSFGVVMLVASRGEERTTLGSYAGLWRRSPALAALMTIFLLSLAGIPPSAGFIAKVNVFSAAISAGHWSLVLIGVIASVAAAFFYLRVIVLMFMQEPAEEFELDPAPVAGVAVALPAILTILLGIVPGLVSGPIQQAAVLRW